ncbi:hypothetical protein FRX31_015209 [Thalictrum thalictroides]|uniref:Zinc knuckle CX2CX4HX4C n=1 Tax=Thalictrum thalictroides TaxID=46969 RepID=A0A7J6WE06_THATH|nr:hypothetical protein FRX31_015209 [Thalictrum thalictroides]
MDLWDSKGFSMVGSAVGRPLFTDRLTEEKRRTSYARIYIEVDTKCKFPRETTVVLDKQKVIKIPIEYNWKPAKCSTCDVFGHHDKIYPKKKQKKVEQSVWVEKEKLEDYSGSVVGDDQSGKDDLQLVVVDEDPVVEKSNEGVRGSEGEKSEECTQNEPNKTPPMSEQPNEEESEKGKQKVSEEGAWETPKKKHTFRPSSPSQNTTIYESIQKRVGEKLAKLKGSNNEGGYGHPQSVQKRSGMTSGGGYGSLHKVTEGGSTKVVSSRATINNNKRLPNV